jgi:hypothetical protein
MAIELTKLSEISSTLGVPLLFVKAMVGLSKPARAALRLQLTSIKRGLQSKLSTQAFKYRIAKRKQVEILKGFSKAGAALSQVKRILNLLNFGSEYNNDPEIQRLIDMLLSNARVKGISLGGYRDADNIVNALNFKAQQVAKSIDFAESAVNTINKKIDIVDKYIKVLNAIDAL